MYALRCTLPLLKRLRTLPSDDAGAPRSTTALGDWFVRPFSVGHHRLLLCTSTLSLLPIIVPAKDLHALPMRLRAALAIVLARLAVAEDSIQRELQAMWTNRIAKTNSQVITGSMTDFVRMADWRVYGGPRAPELITLSLELAEAPCGPINHQSPKDVARALLQRVA
jgi:hypothetical protein